ncbi:zinc finger protein 345-like isoform X1 [Lates japonicus]|uniref:Zinc finger protein 345-like isoform X1 n=1 Tax=Lates japonicus TaxID=270547 RepID=A0AAD3RHC5_LATJO|nr:zinc finger protein 345-like isoform X1 [Lates japonicus]
MQGNLVKHETHMDQPGGGVCGERVQSSDSLSDHLRSYRETVSGARALGPGALRRHKKIQQEDSKMSARSRTDLTHRATCPGAPEDP